MGAEKLKKLRIVAVGKLKESYFTEAVDEYLKRLKSFCEPEIVELKEFPPEKLNEECNGIIEKLKGKVIVTDIQGKLVTSEELSEIVDSSYLSSDTLSVVIGGSCGVNDEVRNSADFVLSFGRVTFPHRLMRVICLEQLYRAFTIKQGLPYHK